jgi:hypothetical protein
MSDQDASKAAFSTDIPSTNHKHKFIYWHKETHLEGSLSQTAKSLDETKHQIKYNKKQYLYSAKPQTKREILNYFKTSPIRAHIHNI